MSRRSTKGGDAGNGSSGRRDGRSLDPVAVFAFGRLRPAWAGVGSASLLWLCPALERHVSSGHARGCPICNEGVVTALRRNEEWLARVRRNSPERAETSQGTTSQLGEKTCGRTEENASGRDFSPADNRKQRTWALQVAEKLSGKRKNASGRDFSPADNRKQRTWALAPEVFCFGVSTFASFSAASVPPWP